MREERTGVLIEQISSQPFLQITNNDTEEKGVIIVFEGPDNSGKSTIAKQLSELSGLPYYKNPRERSLKAAGEIGLVTRYAGLWFADFIQQVPVACILDRHYVSEWAYTIVEQRERDEILLRHIDTLFAKAGAFIIICTKKNYDGYTDELTPNSHLSPLAEVYKQFAAWSVNKRILYIDTTDENLDEQCEIIRQFIQARI
jgi:thymidylate kinase